MEKIKKAGENAETNTETNVEDKNNEVKDTENKGAENEAPAKSETTVIVVDGAKIDESVHPEEEEMKDLVQVTKDDGTIFFVEKVETEDPEEKKKIYAEIVKSDVSLDAEGKVEEEKVDKVLENINSDIDKDEKIVQSSYVSRYSNKGDTYSERAMDSLNNSFYLFKTDKNKMKAVKAGLILNKSLKNSIIEDHINKSNNVIDPSELFSVIASKIGNSVNDLSNSIVKVQASLIKSCDSNVKAEGEAPAAENNIVTDPATPVAEDSEKTYEGKGDLKTVNVIDLYKTANECKIKVENIIPRVDENDQDTIIIKGKDEDIKCFIDKFTSTPKTVTASAITDENKKKVDDKQIFNFSVRNPEAKNGLESVVAVEGDDITTLSFKKDGKSKVASLYAKLPATPKTGGNPEMFLRNFDKEQGNGERITVAAQLKILRESTEKNAALQNKINVLESQLKEKDRIIKASENEKEENKRLEKIEAIIVAKELNETEEIEAMREKLSKYDNDELDAVYEILTTDPEQEAKMSMEEKNEKEYQDEQKKVTASLMKGGSINGVNIGFSEGAEEEEDYAAKLREREIAKCNKGRV